MKFCSLSCKPWQATAASTRPLHLHALLLTRFATTPAHNYSYPKQLWPISFSQSEACYYTQKRSLLLAPLSSTEFQR